MGREPRDGLAVFGVLAVLMTGLCPAETGRQVEKSSDVCLVWSCSSDRVKEC